MDHRVKPGGDEVSCLQQNLGRACAAGTMGAVLRQSAKQELTSEQHAARFDAEAAALARHYCDVFKFWRACPFKRCRKLRRCDGDQTACLKRRVSEIPRPAQWRARQEVLRATPADVGAPERSAREFLPNALADLGGAPKGGRAG
jgi:hypothetical protein